MFWMERNDMDDNEYSTSEKIKTTRMQFSMLLSFSNHCHCHLSISAENEILNESPDASSVCVCTTCLCGTTCAVEEQAGSKKCTHFFF